MARRWGVHGRDCLAAGDSGNDRGMLQQGFRGVVVANAQPERQELYGPDMYHARRSCAAGVVEGMDYWLGNDEPD